MLHLFPALDFTHVVLLNHNVYRTYRCKRVHRLASPHLCSVPIYSCSPSVNHRQQAVRVSGALSHANIYGAPLSKSSPKRHFSRESPIVPPN